MNNVFMNKKFKSFYVFIWFLAAMLSMNIIAFARTFQPKPGDAHKTWTIKFNKDVDIKTIKDNITVEDSKGNLVNATIEASGSVARVKAPTGGYASGEYTIKVSDKIKSAIGKRIKEGYEMKFTVAETIEENDIREVHSYDELLSVVEKRVKNFKIVDKHVQEVYDKANEIISSVTNTNMTELEKEKSLHDYVVKNTAYDYDNYLNKTVPSDSHNPYGILIKNTGVCSGYAETMKLLLNMVGIECDVVSGEVKSGAWSAPHAWNKVKIDGKKYNLDATWDDPAPDKGLNYVRYNYFNISDDELSKDHNWDISVNIDGKQHTFKYTYYKFCKENNIKVGTTKKIRGKFLLPNGEKAPKWGAHLYVTITSDSATPGATYDDIKYVERLDIPEGENFVEFTKDVLLNKEGYTISYFFSFLEYKEGYETQGFYTTNEKTPEVIDPNILDEKPINIEIKKEENLIRGKISLADGELAPKGGIRVELYAIGYDFIEIPKHGGSILITNSKTVIIPEGQNSVEYNLKAISNKCGYYIEYYIRKEGYYEYRNYYKEDGVNITRLYANEKGNEVNITLYKNKE